MSGFTPHLVGFLDPGLGTPVSGGRAPLWPATPGCPAGGARRGSGRAGATVGWPGALPGQAVIGARNKFQKLDIGTVDKSRKQKAGDVLGHKSPGVGPSGSPGGTGAASVFGGSHRRVESEEEKSYGGRKGDDPPANSEPAKKLPQKSQQGSR